ncbi:MAG TPA: hypothetical protein VHK69_19395, partial [Chitinophagaceae bacterium]|nr:hypothetical protein [Chitinophagaceae bacterium]
MSNIGTVCIVSAVKADENRFFQPAMSVEKKQRMPGPEALRDIIDIVCFLIKIIEQQVGQFVGFL